MNNDNVMEIRKLETVFPLKEGTLRAVDDVSMELSGNAVLGLIGESGCGKSVTAQSIMRIVPPPGKVSGNIYINTGNEWVDVVPLPPGGRTIRALRGKAVSMIFQEPMTSFSPIHTVQNQIVEAIRIHEDVTVQNAVSRAEEMLARVGVPHPQRILLSFPFQLSGGLRQRAMIAMALCGHPSILIADEPTTALDVTVQAQLLELLKELQSQFKMGILYITHDLGVVARIAHYVAVMYLGRIVEMTDVRTLFHQPLHPYTIELLKAIPRVGRKKRRKIHSIEGVVPTPIDMPPMCGFFARCRRAISGVCDSHTPPLEEVKSGHYVRCFAVQSDLDIDAGDDR